MKFNLQHHEQMLQYLTSHQVLSHDCIQPTTELLNMRLSSLPHIFGSVSICEWLSKKGDFFASYEKKKKREKKEEKIREVSLL